MPLVAHLENSLYKCSYVLNLSPALGHGCQGYVLRWQSSSLQVCVAASSISGEVIEAF